MDYSQLIFWILIIAAGLIVLRFVWALFSLAIPLLIAAVIGLFVLDKYKGGDAIDQIAARIANWIKSKTGG